MLRTLRTAVAPAALRYYRWHGDPMAALLAPQTIDNPYPLWSEIRERGLYRSKLGMWATASHATATALLRDPRVSASPTHQKRQPLLAGVEDPAAAGPTELSLLTMDPPEHTRIRRLLAGSFSPRALAALEPWIRARTAELLDRLHGSDGFDLIDALAFPVPMAVICRLLGVPPEDQDRFRRWGHDAVTNLEPSLEGSNPAGIAAALELQAYMQALIAQRRAQPDESLLSALIEAESDGERLSFEELVAVGVLLLVAGFETTVNLIGNGTMALIGAPDQWAVLRDHPELVPGAVEELLRFDSPVQMTSRVATEDLELEGQVVEKGDSVVVVLGGANHDPTVFDHPDRLDVTRPNASQHLSFSLGIHHCLGAALARMEGRIVFEELTTRFPGLALSGPPVRRPLVVLRGFDRLPVRVRPEGA